MKLSEKAFVIAQHALPHHLLSRTMGQLTHSKAPWIKRLMIQAISRAYQIDLSEAERPNPEDYESFNEFFTRALRPGARPIAQDPKAIASPADGFLSQRGAIEEGKIIQAKGLRYDINTLLGGDALRAAPFEGGHFLTIYLSPRDYHRLHMPLSGHLREMIHIPGRLFSVNETTTRGVPELFARNERVVAIFDTDHGSMALILIGAIFVASIETVWHGIVTPPSRSVPQGFTYPEGEIMLEKGSEMGRFNMGSTIVALFSNPKLHWNESIELGSPVRMGVSLGRIGSP